MGHRIGMGGDPGTKTDIEIIGVVRDSKYENLREAMPLEVFIPFDQRQFANSMSAYIRTVREPEQMFSIVRTVVSGLDSNLPLYRIKTVEKQVENSLVTERLVATLSSAFGLLATVLAAIGLYGVMAYTVARRTREIGVRMALGAASSDVIWLVMREVLVLVGIGVAIALPTAWGLTGLVKPNSMGSRLMIRSPWRWPPLESWEWLSLPATYQHVAPRWWTRSAPCVLSRRALRRRGRERFAFLNHVHANQLHGLSPGVSRFVFHAAWNNQTFTCFEFLSGFPFHQEFAFTSRDIADLVPRMRVTSRRGSGSNFDVREHRFAPGHGYISFLHYRPLNASALRE